MMDGYVTAIFTCPDAGLLMRPATQVRALPSRGLDGDRYASGRGSYSRSKRKTVRDVSFIAAEVIEHVNGQRPLEQRFKLQDTRRNIVTRGLMLTELIGRKFLVGAVQMRGIADCAPCKRPSELSGIAGFKEAFAGRGGLRAEILSEGTVFVGAPIRILGNT